MDREYADLRRRGGAGVTASVTRGRAYRQPARSAGEGDLVFPGTREGHREGQGYLSIINQLAKFNQIG
jgi:hypothetical protein